MLDKKNPEDEPRQKRSFIREKVVKQPLTRKQILFRAGCVILAAAACGAAAGTMFAVVSPVAQRYLGQESTEESTAITIPRDEPESSASQESPPEEVPSKPEQTEEMKENQNGQIIELVQKVLKEHNQTAENPENYRMLTVSGIVSKNEIYFNPENAPGVNEVNTFDHLKMFYALPLEAYNRIMGTNLELAPGEAYLYAKDSDFPYDQITVENSGTWRIKGHLDKMISNGNNMANMNSSFYLVVSGLEDIKALEEGNVSVYGVNGSYEKWYYNFDLSCGDEEQIQIQNEIDKKINALAEQESEESDTLFFGASTDSRAASRADYQALYGGLFFLGILLGVVFILGMVLIIYYKQITEGYEDQDRFQILMKVRMTQKEVRQTINS